MRADEQIVLDVLRDSQGEWKTGQALRDDPRVYQRMSAAPGRLGQIIARLVRRGLVERDLDGYKRIYRAVMAPGTVSTEQAREEILADADESVRPPYRLVTASPSSQAHEHNYQSQTLRHSHPGGRVEHGYFEHPEDGVPEPELPSYEEARAEFPALAAYADQLVTPEPEPGTDPVSTTYRVDGSLPELYIGVTEKARMWLGEKLNGGGVNWTHLLTSPDQLLQMLDSAIADRNRIANELHPLPRQIREALAGAPERGMTTAEIMTHLDQGTQRGPWKGYEPWEVAAELRNMMREGTVQRVALEPGPVRWVLTGKVIRKR